MNLIILYGPPAVGKLTIGKILKEKLGYSLLYNHMLSSPLEDLFPFHNPSRRKLVREFRLRIIEEAMNDNLNVIITLGNAGSPTFFTHISEIMTLIEFKENNVYLVQLTADKESLLSRVDDTFRKEHGKNFGQDDLQELFDNHTTLFDKYPQRNHLTIDTKGYSPEKAAMEIIKHYKLTP